MEEESVTVQLYIYDLSMGMAKTLSPLLLGRQISAIHHTSIVVFGREFYFGSQGIDSCSPGESVVKEPMQIIQLGRTEIPYALFTEYVSELGKTSFSGDKYDLFKHNCNTFSNELAQFLTGKGIPEEILKLPEEVMSTPFGARIAEVLSAQTSQRNENAGGIPFWENARRNLEQRNSSNRSPERQAIDPISRPHIQGQMSATVENPGRQSQSPENQPPVTPRKTRKYEDPAICFEPIDGTSALQVVEERLQGKLSDADSSCLREFAEYINTDCGSWSLGGPHLDLLGILLNERQDPKIRLATVQFLSACALKEDFILFLHQDRKSHAILNYVYKIEKLPGDEQDAVMILMCNLCKHNSSFDWLMYISEWPADDGTPGSCNNCKVTTRAVVHALLCDRKETQERAAALMYNLALKELFDDQATEFATALLQYLHSDLSEEASWRALVALFRFCQISYNDVPALCSMLGPDLSKFSRMSKRVDAALENLREKIANPGGAVI